MGSILNGIIYLDSSYRTGKQFLIVSIVYLLVAIYSLSENIDAKVSKKKRLDTIDSLTTEMNLRLTKKY